MEQFYTRCLLCTCIPDVTPHLHIFSEAGKQLQLANKLNNINIQIDAELPQNVCHSCMEKLEVTHELVTKSRRARIMLLQIKQEEEKKFEDNKQEIQTFEHTEQPEVLQTNEQTPDDFDNKHDVQTFEHFEQPSDSQPNVKQENSDCSMTELAQPTTDSDNEMEENEIPNLDNCSAEDFDQSDNDPAAQVSQQTSKPESVKKLTIFDLKKCQFCNLHLYRQVWDLHTSLRHKKQTSHKPTNINPTLQCPTCQSIVPAESMQSHISQKHPPKPNPELKHQSACNYCNIKFSYSDLSHHLESHGANAWMKCIHCTKMVRNTKIDLEIHLFQQHSGGKLLVCRFCDRKYAATGKEQAHMQTYVSCKYKCPLQSCSKVFETVTAFSYHVLFYHPKFEQEMQDEIKKETDDILQSQTQAQPSARKPTKSSEQILEYSGAVECDICNQILKHKYSLVHHKNTKHKMSLTFDCDQCSKKFLSLKKASEHIRVVHAVKDHVCEVCGKNISKLQLKRHMGFHQRHPSKPQARRLLDSLLNPVYCAMCFHCARHKLALVRHLNNKHQDVMGEVLPYYCAKCDKEYDKYGTMAQHLRAKHLPKHKCDQCGKMVSQNLMWRHRKLHETRCNGTEGAAMETEQTEEFLTSEIEIEEHAIKLEPGEDQLDCLPQNDDVEPLLESQLPVESQMVVPKIKCEPCCTNKETQLATRMQAHQTPSKSVENKLPDVNTISEW